MELSAQSKDDEYENERDIYTGLISPDNNEYSTLKPDSNPIPEAQKSGADDAPFHDTIDTADWLETHDNSKNPACNMANAAGNSGQFVVVNQMYPQQSDPGAPAFGTTPHVFSVLGKFLKGDTKALGIVQIMIGVLNISFGIVLAVYPDHVGILSGIVFWGALIYISSGSLSVAAYNKLNKCLVNGALVMNIFSTISAGFAIIIFSLEFVKPNGLCYHDYSPHCYVTKDRSSMISGVLLVFSILEFIISIYVSAFACKAVCNCCSGKVVYIQYPNNGAPENLVPAPDGSSKYFGGKV